MQIAECPICGPSAFRVVVPKSLIRQEINLRNDLVHARLGYKASPTELKDLTDFMHGFPAPLTACTRCGIIMRAEAQVRAADQYEEDPNDSALMAQVYPRYVEAFRHKEIAYRDLLPPHSDVLELGSHLGGFLQAAEEWNWRPVGLDVGQDTSEFARSRGFDVRRELIADTGMGDSNFRAIFIWNCFEQLLDPGETINRAWRMLTPHGLLVIRVPNALFYMRGEPPSLTTALAYNNLLGFPYLYGYAPESLKCLVESRGFKYLRGFNSELITMPFADITERLAREQKAISQIVAAWSTATTLASGTLTGPWIEMVFRKISEPRHRPARLPKRRIDTHFLERAA